MAEKNEGKAKNVRETIGGEFAISSSVEIKAAFNELIRKYHQKDFAQFIGWEGRPIDFILLSPKAGRIIFALWKSTPDFKASVKVGECEIKISSCLPISILQKGGADGTTDYYVRVYSDEIYHDLKLISDLMDYHELLER